MKKIIIAPDSFKGSISAADAANAIAMGIRDALDNVLTVTLPIADGGEGTLDALVPAEARIYVPAFNTRSEPAAAEFGRLCDTAVIESASAVGLGTVPEEERSPALSTTKGVGVLIRAALDRGFRRIMLTVGGTEFMGMYSKSPISVGDYSTPEASVKALLTYKTKMKKKKAATENK